jgi:hypothetical protein
VSQVSPPFMEEGEEGGEGGEEERVDSAFACWCQTGKRGQEGGGRVRAKWVVWDSTHAMPRLDPHYTDS